MVARRTVERVWAIKIPEGRAEGLRFMRHMREPLRTFHQPLLVVAYSHMAESFAASFCGAGGSSTAPAGTRASPTGSGAATTIKNLRYSPTRQAPSSRKKARLARVQPRARVRLATRASSARAL